MNNVFEYLIFHSLNNAAMDNSDILNVMKGEKTLNDISDKDIVKVPPKILQGMKVNFSNSSSIGDGLH